MILKDFYFKVYLKLSILDMYFQVNRAYLSNKDNDKKRFKVKVSPLTKTNFGVTQPNFNNTFVSLHTWLILWSPGFHYAIHQKRMLKVYRIKTERFRGDDDTNDNSVTFWLIVKTTLQSHVCYCSTYRW